MGLPQFPVLRTHFPERQREARTGVFGCAWTWALRGSRFYLVNEEARGLSSSWWGRLCAVASAEPFLWGWGVPRLQGEDHWCRPCRTGPPSSMGLQETRGNRSALLPGQLLLTQACRPESPCLPGVERGTPASGQPWGAQHVENTISQHVLGLDGGRRSSSPALLCVFVFSF